MRTILLLIISTLMLNSCTSDNNRYNKAVEELDLYFSQLYNPGEPGAAVLVMKGDSIFFEKGYGIADMNTMSPIEPNTFFNIASVSKQFSAVALMMLQNEGKLSLDDNVKKWFPEFTSPLMEDITLRHLLSHTSGIPDARDRSDRLFVTTAIDTLSYAYIATLDKLNFEPGTSYEYMNPTYQLMYTIIERASGMDFDTFMKERIFDVAGMSESTYFEADKYIPRMAHGYLLNRDTGVYDEYDYGEESFFATKADGGLYTSVREFVNWELAIRNNVIIDEQTRKEAQSAKIDIADTPYTSYGYGWYIEQKPEYPEKIYHTGDNGGFQIYAGRYPEQKILYLIFSNRNDRDREKSASTVDEILKRAGLL